MDRSLVQPAPPPLVSRKLVPDRLRKNPHPRRNRGLTTTPEPSGEPGEAQSRLMRSGGGAGGSLIGGPPDRAVLSCWWQSLLFVDWRLLPAGRVLEAPDAVREARQQDHHGQAERARDGAGEHQADASALLFVGA